MGIAAEQEGEVGDPCLPEKPQIFSRQSSVEPTIATVRMAPVPFSAKTWAKN